MLVHFDNLLNSEPIQRLVHLWNMYPSTLWFGLIVYSCGARPFWGLKFLTLVGSVHLVDLCRLFDLSWVCPLCGHESWSLAGSIHLVGLCKLFTLVGSVHFVDMNFDPPWGPSTLWTYVSFDPCWVRLLCGQESWSPARSVHLMGLRKFFTLVGSVHFVDMNLIPRGIRPPCGLM